VGEAQGQSGNPEEGERSPLEAVTRGLVKTKLTVGASLWYLAWLIFQP
jgi:hypothetical protein